MEKKKIIKRKSFKKEECKISTWIFLTFGLGGVAIFGFIFKTAITENLTKNAFANKNNSNSVLGEQTQNYHPNVTPLITPSCDSGGFFGFFTAHHHCQNDTSQTPSFSPTDIPTLSTGSGSSTPIPTEFIPTNNNTQSQQNDSNPTEVDSPTPTSMLDQTQLTPVPTSETIETNASPSITPSTNIFQNIVNTVKQILPQQKPSPIPTEIQIAAPTPNLNIPLVVVTPPPPKKPESIYAMLLSPIIAINKAIVATTNSLLLHLAGK